MRLVDVDELAKHEHWQKTVDDLRCAPIVDAVPVAHSYWMLEDDEEEPNAMYKVVVCAHCGKMGGHNFKYCPNCGSKMDAR